MKSMLFLICMGMIFAGCGGGGGESAEADGTAGEEGPAVSDDPLVGKWEIVEVTEGPDYSNVGTYYVFNADGSMSSGQGSMSIDGTYEVSGDTLKIILGGISMDILMELDGDQLTYDIINGEQTFLMERVE